MKSLIIATATMLFFYSVNAQSGSIPVAKIQKLLEKAAGQKYFDFEKNDVKIMKQEVTGATYTLYYNKDGKKYVEERTNIPWSGGFELSQIYAYGNDKLTQCVFDFKKELKSFSHIQGESGFKITSFKLKLFVLTKDYAEFEALIKQ
jgi:hypothetical protein